MKTELKKSTNAKYLKLGNFCNLYTVSPLSKFPDECDDWLAQSLAGLIIYELRTIDPNGYKDAKS